MTNTAYSPRCKKCDRDHYNYIPCHKVPDPPKIEWRDTELAEWGDRVQGAPGGVINDMGWGCHTILPQENPKS